MKHFFLFGLFFYFGFIYSQNTILSKLSYQQLIDSFHKYKGQIEIQKKFAKEYLNRGKKEKDIERIAGGYYFHSYFYNDNNCFKYCDSAIEITKNFKNQKFPMVAYSRKTDKYVELKDYVKAIDNLLLSEKYALKFDNLMYYYDAKNNIGIVKSEYLGEYNEAIDLYKESLDYFKTKIGNDKDYNNYYLGIIFGIADSYKSLKNTDSSTFYNQLGYKESIRLGAKEMKNLFILNEGANQVFKQNYYATIDSIDKALPLLIESKDLGNIIAANFYYGKAYEGLKNDKKAIYHFKNVDSLYLLNGRINPDFVDGYMYLVNYYKRIDDKENQLLYINKFIKIDSVLKYNYQQLNNKIKYEYEIPHLIKDKENIINELESSKKINIFIIITVIGIFLLALFYGIRQTKLKKIYKKRFETLIENKNENKTFKITDTVKNAQFSNGLKIGLTDETIINILEELENFEKNRGYLDSSVSLQILAQKLNTNSKYLSLIINSKKEKNFTQYINDLRIDNIINELKNTSIFRNYTIMALANEAGFNNAESFSKAFFKRTGIKPSYFIKELKERYS
ncbi:helix-turn-helix domain-containing protein [Flavobacterium sp. TP390]|uniref:Helix-turn-helix domain-containing protein n=1 Tax=Flavobacterium profundi TaxID=1774945 RepID=A0A6I4IGG0_9FLAO|nr:helix-turn-helix domain-containing protein [Flavobacterium profundi]MVO08783.1 helix-turn-helix domain-containing protein [Flavobacterium profundi]